MKKVVDDVYVSERNKILQSLTTRVAQLISAVGRREKSQQAIIWTTIYDTDVRKGKVM